MAKSKENIEEIAVNVHNIQRLLTILEPETARQHKAVETAQETLTFWQKDELNRVQKAFEE